MSKISKIEFLTLHILKTKKLPMVNIVFPVQKKIVFSNAGLLSLSGGRTTWKIQTAMQWNDSYIDEPVLPEVSSLFLTPTKFSQWPRPILEPSIEILGGGEACITFFGFEDWDSYLGDSK
jgi:hypothetical protein